MLVPINWMKEYVNINADAKSIADAVTLSGSHVDSINFADNGISGIKIGRITEVKQHPNADKLVVTKVDLGDREVVIVTAAKNVFEGALVPVALSGAVLASGDIIGNHDFRGIISEGMFCSYQELGYGDSVIPKEYRDGILILKDEFELGSDIVNALDMEDSIIEFEITPNRPDCLSIIGMARETAATFDQSITMPEITEEFKDHDELLFGGVEIKTENCDKFVLRVLDDVKIEESPNWLQNYLMKAGVRPINNIVDITNFVMFEFGQPLHAYDLDKITGNKLYVRCAENGEVVKCIDSKERKLESGDIIIADESGPVGIAGVMGGFDTEVTKSTKRILLESARFDRESIRNTSKRLGLRSEASTRAEKGIPIELVEQAAARFCTLVEKLGSATVLNEKHIADNSDNKPIQIEMKYDSVNKLLGTEITKEQMINYLERLEFKCEDNGETCSVTVPGFRTDIEIEADLIEEIGRLYGFHNITPQPLCGQLIKGGVTHIRSVEDLLKRDLYALGYFEALSYSFISPKASNKAGIDDENSKNYIKLINPLGEEFSVMRTTVIPNMIDILAKNQKQKAEEITIYELGNIFVKSNSDDEPLQKRRLCLGMYGDVDFYTIRADIKALLNRIGIMDVRFKKNSETVTFHPGRCAEVFVGDISIGIMGELSYEISERYDLNKRSYIAELDVNLISENAVLTKTYEKIIKYPSMNRDIALVLDKSVSAEEIEGVIKSVDSDIIEDVKLFDIFTGEQIGEDKKSMAYEIIYRSKDRTLVDEEVNEVQKEIVNRLESKFGASLRN